jgi:prolyl-tRNA synthetase
MLEVYATFAEEYMALPVVRGVKTANERFAGAEDTYCIEALMQDGKALQAGTSHFLGQNFAKAFDVQFRDKDNKLDYVWATSWGVSTRLVGALVMAHSDDQGLVLPPRIAPLQVVVVPIFNKDVAAQERINNYANELVAALKAQGVRVKYDNDDNARPGWKFAEYELKGVPVRIALGPRDMENNVAEVARRDTKEKASVSLDNLAAHVIDLIADIQSNMFIKATNFRNENTRKVDTWDEFIRVLDEQAGFVAAHWDGTPATEEKIKELTKATIRCIPLNNEQEEGKCILTGNPSTQRVLFARAY